jgi:hypothetical protein
MTIKGDQQVSGESFVALICTPPWYGPVLRLSQHDFYKQLLSLLLQWKIAR